MSEDKTQQIEAMRNGLRLVADEVYEAQVKIGNWPPFEEDVADLSGAFADLHAKVARAYEGYQEGTDHEVTWVDEVTGAPTEKGKGVPTGLLVAFGEILFDTLALSKRLGMDPGQIAEIAVAHSKYVETSLGELDEVEEVEGDGEAGEREPDPERY